MKKLFLLFIIFCLGIVRISAQEVTFRASSERTVVVNQQFRIAYTLSTSGQEKAKNLQLGDIKNFDVLYEPVLSQQGTSTSIINGKVSSSFTAVYTCIVMAKAEGTFTIPPATITVGNSTYKSNELTVTVLPADQAANAAAHNNNASQAGQQQAANASASNKDVFVVMHVSKNSVYENEGFLVTFKLYSLIDISGFEGAKFPEFEGFISQEIDLGQNTQMNLESYNGRNYRTAIIKQTVLYPQRSGKITIGAGKFDIVVRIRSQQRVRSFFDDFFDTYSDVKRSLTSAPVTIDVKSLPAGKPASFSGAVGEYAMTSSISSDKVKSDDAVTVKVNISGNGNIKLLKNPEVVFPNDFEVFDPVVDTKTSVTQSGVRGTKSVEYNAIPRYAGDFTIPAVEFSYFDLKSQTYKTLSTPEYQLHVEQGEAGSGTVAAPVLNATNKEDIRFLGKDVRYIKTGNYRFHQGSFFFGTLNYYLFYIVPALLFIILFIIYRKQAAENANIALVRTKKANKVASKRLKAAAKYLHENKQEAFYDETLKAVWGYLSDKLNIPVSALTKDNVEADLTQYGVDENLIRDFRNILDTAEFARFAPAQGSGAMDELYRATVKAIDKMESIIKK
ncbi:MAG: BatD family protein [Dysgonamonadaceae bacterium]|nr:BatD family protein [Dysgonamonadaceae bacterium]